MGSIRVICLKGPKCCGKTTTASMQAGSVVKMQDPDLLMVLTSGNMAYRRPNGVLVVPIGCLKD